ncbi:hypothetical protein FB567DRAFT_622885 [Paraphoma chrysanthemicola]|uniref:DUF7918 domain-containing protein n=1 Tax=Paraphoma chrysanthemicola TaxID=798071 RepID=A0A8K0RFP6_9PLEO|nr:hypothetical protein FB567DRAFT_622885 [Paraphoma chrysanthemicola]
MAIVPALPGLLVTVEVAGEALPEYDCDDSDDQYAISRYIEAPLGTEFEIRSLYQTPYSPTSMVQIDIILDGDYVQAPFLEWGGKDECEGYKYGKATFITEDQLETRRFRFAPLVTEETDQQVTEETKRKISSIGKIELYFYYIEGLEEAKPTIVPRQTTLHDDPINQKAVKATITPGDSLTCRTDLSAPEPRETVTFSQVKTMHEPFAKFTFLYRSTGMSLFIFIYIHLPTYANLLKAVLKSLGIIQRTPTPSPEPDPDPESIAPESMNTDELRAEVLRLRNIQQQLRGIKREREDSAGTMVGENDADIEWTRSQPSKRARRSPGEGDEVICLEE